MKKKQPPSPSFKQRLKKVKKRSAQALDTTKKTVKDGLNINRYNKRLFIFETILLVGVIDEFFETLIMGLDISLYFHILLLMISIGVLFTVALHIIENIGKGTIIWLVRLNQNKILRFFTHIIILSFLFYLYARVFFGTNVSLVFNIGLNAS